MARAQVAPPDASLLEDLPEVELAFGLQEDDKEENVLQASYRAGRATGLPGFVGSRQWSAAREFIPPVQPANWMMGPYFNSGVNFVLGDGLISADQDAGYTITGGVRQPTGFAFRWGRTFLDLGGSYQSLFGTSPIQPTYSAFESVGGAAPVERPDAYRETLEEVRRAGVHLGLGLVLGSLRDSVREDPQVRVSTTAGGRWSHVSGRFSIEQLVFPVAPGNAFIPQRDFSKTDSSFGLFWKTEAVLLQRATRVGDLQLTLSGEVAHDFVNLTGFAARDITSAAVLFGFMVAK